MIALSPVERIRVPFGDGVVMVAIAKRRKNPSLNGWQGVRLDAMKNPAYLQTLENGNVGVLTGEPSGGLCALDFDANADAETFLAKNPLLASSFRSRGARGFQIWVRIQGGFPASGDAKDAVGRKVCEWAGKRAAERGLGHAHRPGANTIGPLATCRRWKSRSTRLTGPKVGAGRGCQSNLSPPTCGRIDLFRLRG